MKKYLLTIFVSVVLIASNFVPARAVTVKEIRQQISVLLAQIEQLKKQLAEIQNQPKEWCFDFNQNLRFGDGRGEADDKTEDVRNMQIALEKEGFDIDDIERGVINSVIHESTVSAVVAFQEKYSDEILKPLHLKHGTGYVGKATRTKLNELYGCKNNKRIPSVSSEKGIVVSFPQNGDFISSPLTIKGYVNGDNGWAGFEGQVGTVELLDDNGNKLSSAILKATTDWIKLPTNFSAVLNFDSPPTSNGKLVFRNEDPSGNNPKTFKIPVRFTHSITVLSPNGGERWQGSSKITDTLSGYENYRQDIKWSGAPDDFNAVHNGRILAYLEKFTHGQFITVGRIPPFSYGSIAWVVGVVSKTSCDKLDGISINGCFNSNNMFVVQADEYYVRVVDTQTGAWGRSDAPFSIVSGVASPF